MKLENVKITPYATARYILTADSGHFVVTFSHPHRGALWLSPLSVQLINSHLELSLLLEGNYELTALP